MDIKLPSFNLKGLFGRVDWKLLLFLVLFMDVKLVVKAAAIVLVYVLQFDLNFGFSLKSSRLPLFYLAIMAIGVIDLVLYQYYSTHNYPFVLVAGLGFWLLCILAIHQVKLFVERNSVAVIHNTIFAFFAINVAVSLLNIGRIIWETHAINPYLYQGEYQKYFISTGDFIKGITFDTSTTNAVLNAFGVLYFLDRKNAAMTLLCMAILVLTGSNTVNVTLLLIMAGLFIFKSTRDQKSIMVACVMLLVVFMAKVSPQNNDYAINTIKSVIYQKKEYTAWPITPHVIPVTQRPDKELNFDERRQKVAMLYLDSVEKALSRNTIPDPFANKVPLTGAGKIVLPTPNLDAPNYQWVNVTPADQLQLLAFVNTHKAELPISGKAYHFSAVPGKVIGMQQTLHFFRAHPAKALTGAGMGNFSSKLAYRATGLRFAGGYPAGLVYINPLFMANHLDVYLNFFSKGPGLHSLTNSPFSVYDQVLAEYGLLGLLALIVGYLWFFARHYKRLSYGIPLLVFVSAIFFIDHWFEQLSVIVFFELMLFVNIKENTRIPVVERKKILIEELVA